MHHWRQNLHLLYNCFDTSKLKQLSLVHNFHGEKLPDFVAIFILQISCIALLFNYFNRSGFQPSMYYTVSVMAFLCCLILHIYIQPGVYRSIERMRFLLSHKHKFEQTFLPFLICLMKLSTELCIEITEIETTFNLNDELWIIMCYSALTCISYID